MSLASALAGTVVSGTVLLLFGGYALQQVQSRWGSIALRIAGAWLAAIAMLNLALVWKTLAVPGRGSTKKPPDCRIWPQCSPIMIMFEVQTGAHRNSRCKIIDRKTEHGHGKSTYALTLFALFTSVAFESCLSEEEVAAE
ncbi:MAG: hypothetical protein R3D29_10525 [Nitratireductor sp.]